MICTVVFVWIRKKEFIHAFIHKYTLFSTNCLLKNNGFRCRIHSLGIFLLLLSGGRLVRLIGFQRLVHQNKINAKLNVVNKAHTFLISSFFEAGDVTDDNEKYLSSLRTSFRTLTLLVDKYDSHPVKILPKSLVSSRYVVSRS